MTKKRKVTKNELIYILMLSPGVIYLLIFNYLPMIGVVIAFQDFSPARGFFGSKWVGLDNFRHLFESQVIGQVFLNTVVIACSKMVFNYFVPIVFALLLNEVVHSFYKRVVQTLVYLPHFISWVVLGVTFKHLFSMNGIANQLIELIFGTRIMFFENDFWFRVLVVLSDTWKDFGFGAILYLAALTNINPNLYEAARIDGANRWRQILHVSIPGMMPTMVLVATLSLSGVLNAGFGQIFNLYNPVVYGGGDIIDTYVYRIGLVSGKFGMSTAVGLLKSVISIFLISTSWWMADKFANYRIF